MLRPIKYLQTKYYQYFSSDLVNCYEKFMHRSIILFTGVFPVTILFKSFFNNYT